MQLETFVVGPNACNCSILVCPRTQEAIVVDPGGDQEEILARLKRLGAKVKLILITHAHFDHVIAAGKLHEISGAPICLHKKDMWLYRIMPLQYKMFGIKDKSPPRPNRLLNEGDLLSAGTLSLSVIHTPGHSPGSCCFHMDDRKLLFSGDTLFNTSVGNWQVPFGSFEPLFDSILKKLMALPDETRVLPGHGEETSIGFERANNPYIKPEKIAELRELERKRPGKLKVTWMIVQAAFRRK